MQVVKVQFEQVMLSHVILAECPEIPALMTDIAIGGDYDFLTCVSA